MSRVKKVSLIVLILLILPILYSVLANFQYAFGWNFELFNLTKIPVIGYGISQYLFWAALVVTAALLIAMLVILFYPRSQKEINLEKKHGKLTIQNKAIEEYILETLKKEPWIKDPKVKSDLVGKKLKVNIAGDFRKGADINQQSSRVINKITTQLKELFGVENKQEVIVKLKNFKTPRKSGSRVT